MKQKLIYLLFLIFLAATIYSAQGVPYQYFSNRERTSLGEIIRFFHGDTLWGPVRSNDTLRYMQHPSFFDFVISFGPPSDGPVDPPENAVFYAPRLNYRDMVAWTRERAEAEGNLFENGADAKALVHFSDHSLRYFWGVQGTPFDTSVFTDYPLTDSAIVFFDCPVQVSGVVHTILIFGAAGEIGLEDNVKYALSEGSNGHIAEDETAKLALITGGSIVILNTWANGRDNSAEGQDIIINALLVALSGDLSTFTFENQNDSWDSYIGPVPDDRGNIFLSGAVYPSRRGYVHRSNNGSTGYLKRYRFDERLRYWQLPVFENPGVELVPETLDFDTVLVDSVHLDSIQIVLEWPALIDVPLDTTPPFTTEERIYLFDSTFYLPVRFSASELGEYSDEIALYVEGNRIAVPVHAVARELDEAVDPASLSPLSFRLSAYPNPFNPVTMLQFDLPMASRVVLDVYNIAGQKVQSIADQPYNAGSHSLSFDGSALATGLYIARLQSNTQAVATKLMLVK